MSSSESDKDETEEVEIVSVCYTFPKFKMHCIEKKKNQCLPLLRCLYSLGGSSTSTGMY